MMRKQIENILRRSPVTLDLARKLRFRLLGALSTGRAPATQDLPGPRVDWRNARPGIAVPPPHVFTDIEVVPATRHHAHQPMFDGGPVWPDFDTLTVMRHAKNGAYIDVNASPSGQNLHSLNEPAIWGGRCFFHFGHLVAEHMNRLPGSLYVNPGATCLFILPPGKVARDVPDHFWAMADWLGLPRGQIRFVTRPMRVARLLVSPQAEQLNQCTPPRWYLDLLDEAARLNKLRSVRNDVLFVTRSSYLSRGGGACAGEDALRTALQRTGVAIMDPERESIDRQMALYAGAKLLIFAEGSALHGRQLLGRVDQKILVLRRRPGSMMAWSMLAPRCREIEYRAAIAGFAVPVNRRNKRLRPHGMAFYDLPALFDILAEQGIDAKSHWDDDLYRQSVERDARGWLRAIMARHDIDQAATKTSVAQVFAAQELGALL